MYSLNWDDTYDTWKIFLIADHINYCASNNLYYHLILASSYALMMYLFITVVLKFSN